MSKYERQLSLRRLVKTESERWRTTIPGILDHSFLPKDLNKVAGLVYSTLTSATKAAAGIKFSDINIDVSSARRFPIPVSIFPIW